MIQKLERIDQYIIFRLNITKLGITEVSNDAVLTKKRIGSNYSWRKFLLHIVSNTNINPITKPAKREDTNQSPRRLHAILERVI